MRSTVGVSHRRRSLGVLAAMMLVAMLIGGHTPPGHVLAQTPAPIGAPGLVMPRVAGAPPEINPLRTVPAGPTVTTSERPGQVCTTITFEGIGDQSPIPNFDGVAMPGWLGLIDSDVGGTGNIAFEPSPSTVALWWKAEFGDPGYRDIVFSREVTYVSFRYTAQLTFFANAYDAADQVIASAVGLSNYHPFIGDPTGDYSVWTLLELESQASAIKKVRLSGMISTVAIDNLTMCKGFKVHSVELTQAIQEWQTLEELKTGLADGEPPVPVVANKPLALRVYMHEVDAVQVVDVQLSGVTTQSKRLTLQPRCTPEKRRRQDDGCLSADFYFTPPEGAWSVTIRTLDSLGRQVEEHTLNVTSRASDMLVLRAVSVCDAKDAMGNWQCADEAALAGMVGMLRKTAPTHDVQVSVTGNQVRRESAGIADAATWWTRVAADIAALYNWFDAALGAAGFEQYYYGMVRPNAPGVIGGIASDIPGRGGASRTSVVRLGVETNTEVVAHETGHLLGRRHTNNDVPDAAGGSPPGCYNKAVDSGTDWPFANNRVQSATRLEVGFDVATRKAILPDDTYEIMSYCVPRWVSPHTYRGELATLSPPAAPAPGAARVARTAATGSFWLVAGTISGGSAALEPLYRFETTGLTAAGTGSHRIEVRDAGGALLFTRFFTPAAAHTERETGGDETTGAASFLELIPVQATAQRIRVLDGGGAQIGEIVLGGAAPTVSMVLPAGGESLNGSALVQWSVSDPDSAAHRSVVQYSADNGATWQNLATDLSAASLRVNFAVLPGCTNTCRIRVLSSDGVNSGIAISNAFSVARHAPAATISFPADGATFRRGDLVWLQGVGFDRDDGVLAGHALRWESSRDGLLGNSDDLPLTSLSEGTHVITFRATDSNNNVATASVTVHVDGTNPVVNLMVTPDGTPASCVAVTISASDAGGSGLQVVEYSLNGGETWTSIPLLGLSLRFTVPGQGYIQLVARAIDGAGNLAATERRFFIETACSAQAGSISGTVQLQGRTVDSPAGLGYGEGHSMATVTLFPNNLLFQLPPNGAFSFTGLTPGAYTLVAAAPGYLRTERLNFQIGPDQQLTLPPLTLRAGAVNSDATVSITDVTAIIAAFGSWPESRTDGASNVVDVNGDGVVNLPDLTLTLSNFGRMIPQTWP